jgi:hypothetical protein
MPTGQTVPIRLPQLAMGGVMGAGLPIEPPAVAHSLRVPEGLAAPGSAAGWTIHNHFSITTPDANSFRQSQSQVMSEWMLALRRAEKRHG